VVETAGPLFLPRKIYANLDKYYKGEKAVVPLSTETKPLLTSRHPNMERPLVSQGLVVLPIAYSPVGGWNGGREDRTAEGVARARDTSPVVQMLNPISTPSRPLP